MLAAYWSFVVSINEMKSQAARYRLHCVNGDRLSQWRMANFDPLYRIESPKAIDQKFCTRDYVGETTPYAKFGANPFTGGFWANRWNITLLTYIYIYIYILFFQLTYRSYPSTDFDARWRFHPRKCLLGVKKLKLTLNPFLFPQMANFGQKVGRKRLTMGTLRSKRP